MLSSFLLRISLISDFKSKIMDILDATIVSLGIVSFISDFKSEPMDILDAIIVSFENIPYFRFF